MSKNANYHKAHYSQLKRAEVTPAEILTELQKGRQKKESGLPLTIKDVDSLEPLSFEVFVAALFQKQGYRVELTPPTGDKGADVIVYQRQGENLDF